MTNESIIMNNFTKNISTENAIRNDNNLSVTNYKIFVTKDVTPHKTQQTPIIKNKRHNRVIKYYNNYFFSY